MYIEYILNHKDFMDCLPKFARSDVISDHLNLCLVCGSSIEVSFVSFSIVASIMFNDGQNIEWYGELNFGLWWQ